MSTTTTETITEDSLPNFVRKLSSQNMVQMGKKTIVIINWKVVRNQYTVTKHKSTAVSISMVLVCNWKIWQQFPFRTSYYET